MHGKGITFPSAPVGMTAARLSLPAPPDPSAEWGQAALLCLASAGKTVGPQRRMPRGPLNC
ncbi:hypothetical protein HYPDE_36798 [Hyphomicrobium denitrificans 1NES1]|uniref:Uncharacterized protein n=1 Tax=Hyphomicrobium denitrificans 1NES1 TaxID=670307 RepID=N0BF36_9HYPH|nr:hypothetical protein HYPDE_36798 [Hyphomicrobium denitrificans 1NES1]